MDQTDFLQMEEAQAQPAYFFLRFHQPYDRDTFVRFLTTYPQDIDYFDKFSRPFEFQFGLQNIESLNFLL